ncbi:MAG: DUF3108 domain-containing protein [Chitinivibrionales bacterium]|nr:DUF3108 domain-containing protein [Chitinivibrionales bacterium]
MNIFLKPRAGLFFLILLARMYSSGAEQFYFNIEDKINTSRHIDWREEEILLRKKLYVSAFKDSLRDTLDVPKILSLRDISQCQFEGVEEKLTFEVKWGFVSAGYGVLSVSPGQNPDCIELTGMAVTHRFLGALYRVKDYSRCEIDTDGFYPLFFEEHIREGRYRSNRWRVYDHVGGKVHASNSKHCSDSVPPFVQTYLSAFYYFRTVPWDVGDTVFVNSFVQGKTYPMYFACIERDTIDIEGAEFPCIRVRPHLKEKAMVFGAGDRVDIWLTDDKYRLPVFVKAKILFGAIKCSLVYGKRVKIK